MRTSVRVSRPSVVTRAGMPVVQKERSAENGLAVRREFGIDETIAFEERTEEILED
jgi:hypothetical protein